LLLQNKIGQLLLINKGAKENIQVALNDDAMQILRRNVGLELGEDIEIEQVAIIEKLKCLQFYLLLMLCVLLGKKSAVAKRKRWNYWSPSGSKLAKL